MFDVRMLNVKISWKLSPEVEPEEKDSQFGVDSIAVIYVQESIFVKVEFKPPGSISITQFKMYAPKIILPSIL